MNISGTNPGCLGAIFQAIGLMPKEKKEEKLPYGLRNNLLTNAELSFYKVLQEVVRDDYVICPKVSLSDLFFVRTKNRSERTSYVNKIRSKHVDFVLCEPVTLKSICGIELDDSSHERQDRVERDTFVDKVFKAADIPLVRVKARRSYSLTEVKDQLDRALSVSQPVENQETKEKEEFAPLCKNCSVPMVLRTVNRGQKKGTKFYGCPNYPECKETVEA